MHEVCALPKMGLLNIGHLCLFHGCYLAISSVVVACVASLVNQSMEAVH
jgi:hypothetical protein